MRDLVRSFRLKRQFYLIVSLIILVLGVFFSLNCFLCIAFASHPAKGIPLMLLGIFISSVLAFLLFRFYYSLDPYEKEPIGLVMLALALGSLVAPLLAILFTLIGDILLGNFVGFSPNLTILEIPYLAPLVEELVKGLCVFLIILVAPEEINSPIDGFLYGAIVGLGFSTAENVLYILKGLTSGGVKGFISSIFLRWTIVIFLHQLTTSYVGAGLAFAKFQKKWTSRLKYILGSLAIAILIHFTWNSVSLIFTFKDPSDLLFSSRLDSAFLSTFTYMTIYLAGAIPLIVLLKRYQRGERKKILTILRSLEGDLSLTKELILAVVDKKYRARVEQKIPKNRRRELGRLLSDLAFLALLIDEHQRFPSSNREEFLKQFLADIKRRIEELFVT